MRLVFGGDENFNARLNHKFGFVVFKSYYNVISKKFLTNGCKQIVSLQKFV